MKKMGVVYLVGAGPGEASLITKKGLDYLKKCDVVVYDRLISNELLDYTKEDCEKIYVGKQAGNHIFTQAEINQILVKKAKEKKIVVRLKGGDPFVFGRGGEEVLALKKADIFYEVVPGVTSAIAAAAYAGIPLTYRKISQSFHVMTGHTLDKKQMFPVDFLKMADLEGTLVFLMGLENISSIVEELIKNGKRKDTKIAVIAKATTIEQKVIKSDLVHIVQKVKEAHLESPAVIVIGEVVDFDFCSARKKVKIGLTGTKELNEKLQERFENIGVFSEIVQSLKAEEYIENPKFDKALKKLSFYNWIVFTSANGVRIFFERMKKINIDFRSLASIKFAVIGTGTEEALASYGFFADYMPERFSAIDLAKGLKEILKADDKVLIPRAQKGSKELIEILEEEKKMFEVIPTYKVTKSFSKNYNIEKLQNFDYFIFASPSAVKYFLEQRNQEERKALLKIKAICIGEITANQLRQYGFFNIITAKEYNIEGLAAAVLEEIGI